MNDLYQKLILEHNRHPRNRHRPQTYNASCELHNPYCGDRVEMFLCGDKEKLKECYFWNQSCALLQASASILMGLLGKNDPTHFPEWKGQLEALLDGREDDLPSTCPHDILPFRVFSGKPSRKKCILLPWEALAGALEKLPALKKEMG